MLGAIFAAYPLATAAFAWLPPLVMRAVGTRASVAIGLCVCAASSLLLACAPLLPTGAVGPVLLTLRGIAGIGAGLAESGAFVAVAESEALAPMPAPVLNCSGFNVECGPRTI